VLFRVNPHLTLRVYRITAHVTLTALLTLRFSSTFPVLTGFSYLRSTTSFLLIPLAWDMVTPVVLLLKALTFNEKDLK